METTHEIPLRPPGAVGQGAVAMRTLSFRQWIRPVLCSVAIVGSAAQVPLQPPKTHGGLTAYAFSPDGRQVAGGSGQVAATVAGAMVWQGGGEVLLWDATTGRLQNIQFQSFPQRVWHPAVAPDLRRVAATRNNQPVLLDW